MRTEQEVKLELGKIIQNLSKYQEKEKVIADMATGFIDGLSWVLGQESILENLATGNHFDKKKDESPLA